jgi:hypothetical protein
MASTYTALGVQLMTTGEKAGLWGGLTNTNWDISEQIAGGYVAIDINGGAQTTNLAVSDGAATDANQVAHRIIEFTGAITGNQIVTIPLDVEQLYVIKNTTSDGTDGYTVQFKYVTGSGSSVTFAGGDRTTKLIYATANDVTNPDIVDAGFGTGDVTLTGTQTLTNKTLTAPAIGTSILDTGGNELFLLTATGSAVNELTYANAWALADPSFTASGGSTNIGITLATKGTGVIQLASSMNPTISTTGKAMVLGF